ncbi:FKBP-type peptidyl-prolyl cis-trans isomerase N-terminal domain-containing protein [Atlantibacter hermannii]|uniref:FKBP-type peptidyl-prolyl cis-trans isomerase N-terminal domain-containing protein n=1 Tax=Atlantibacter hermannii TaxID=565 RepID=UPI00289A50A5|nr:FKBP-type peptidyl-prolyl cis-trans isomerase N-terminal domain-containing protein [Atlantibacter hermannii]MDW4576844.1 FKBP-type peptidyl-prolyl cis-trans isomerase N-terminal domain-containing protein [Atlantibacter hermannii]
MPEPARRASGKPAHPKKQTSPSHPSQSPAASQESSQQLATLRASWVQEKAALQKKASESQKENETLRQQLAQAQSGQDAAGNSKSSLQKTLTESASRITALLRQVDELTATRRDLLLAQSANQQALLASKKETERLQGENAALITAQKDDAQQKQKQQQLIQQSEQSRQALEQQLAKLQAALDASQQQLAANSKQLAENNKKLAGVTESQAAKEKALAEAQQQLKTSQQSVQTLKTQIAQLTGTQDEKAQQLAKLQAALDASQQQLKTSQQSAQTLKTQIAQLTGSQDEKAQQLAKLQAALDASQQQLAANSKQLAENNKKLAGVTESQAAKEKALAEATVLLKTRDETIKGLQQNAQQAAKNSETVKAELQEAQKKLDAQSRQLADLQKAPMPVASGEMPKTKDEIRDYALGVYWAHEIANMIKSKESLGYRIGQQQVLNGVTDLIHNQLKIPQQELLETLKELDQQSQDKEKNAATAAKTEGKAFMTRFSKTAGVKRDPMGYYYMIVNKGETKIKGSDTVALTMRESLVNGKVINDMAEKGTVLTLPLDRFPPLFKSAISKVNNLGELRIVVPPELAYGEAGNMPDIPPDSTMIYDIKIVGMKKNAQK